MHNENTLDKLKLITELREAHKELVKVYKELFESKNKSNIIFREFINKEYEENGVSVKEHQAWNDNFCHRASYTLLNKILFVRICEDKGFMLNSEDYIAGVPKDPHIGEKLSKIGLQKWANLITNYTLGELVKFAFLDMKKSYRNIVLYKNDKYDILNPTHEELSIKYVDDDSETFQIVSHYENVLNGIIDKLDTNNFNFKYADGNILGDVYEKFMDRETRKAVGQFYTPEYIIEYILSNTISKADVVENPFVSVADISCGSGHFLIMAYDILKEKFINNLELLSNKYSDEVYTIKRNGKLEKLTGREYWKEENIHYHILKHCIFGADIDSFAVQLTTINLLLKDLDNFTDQINIIQCDSLIKWEKDYDWRSLEEQLNDPYETIKTTQVNLLGEEESYEIKQKKVEFILKYLDSLGIERIDKIGKEAAEEIIELCKFWDTRFDYVVGNPPYVGHKQLSMEYKEWLLSNYNDVFKDKSDLSFCFFERIVGILSENGISGIITSRYFMESPTGKSLRVYLSKNAKLRRIVDFYGAEIFKGVGIATAIYFFSRIEIDYDYKNLEISKLINDEYIFDDSCNLIDVIQSDIFENFITSPNNLEYDRWILIPEQHYKIYKKIINSTKYKLDDIVTSFQGIITGCDKAFVLTLKESDEFGIEPDLLKRWIKNSNVKKYLVSNSDLVLIYSDLIVNESDYPNSIDFINKYKDRLENRRECKSGVRKWYQLQWGRESNLFEQPKIIFPYKAKNNKFALDFENCYCSADVYSLVMKDKFRSLISLEYLVGVLNSSIYEFYFKLFAKKMGKGIYDYYPNSVLDLKIITDGIKDQIDCNSNKIIELYSNVKKICIDELSIYEDIIKHYISIKNENAKINEQILLLQKENENIIASYLGLDEEDLKIINNKLNIKDFIETKNLLNIDKFYNNYVVENKTLEQIALENDLSKELIDILYYTYIDEFLKKGMNPNKIDLTDLINSIYEYLQEKIYSKLKLVNKPMNLEDIKNTIYIEESNLIKIIKSIKLNNIKINIEDLIKDSLDNEALSWNAFRKSKKDNKVNKIFVKYYDNNYYGLTDWTDEIHKNYFLYTIEEYSINSKNEKKSKIILELFKDLIIEDKNEYIEVIEDKIKNVFN